ncbi:MAG TPA: TIM-barrel domain-containing protein, partial [Bacteroidota bacterium]
GGDGPSRPLSGGPRRPASLVVLRRWTKVPWRLEQGTEQLTVHTSRISASVDRRTGAVTFRDSAGVLLVREDPAIPHLITPATVASERTFHVLERLRPSPEEAFYGLGQFEDGTVNYRGHDIVLVQNNRHIVVPFLVSSRCYGILWDNYSDTRFHDGPDGTTLLSEVGDGINYYFIAGRSIDDVIAGYREATGRVPMFPRWAFGYWQSKERYENQDQLMNVAREYRRRQIPIDNIVQDWQYWGSLGWNAMDFDRKLYPDPKGMIDSLHRLYALHLMLSIWPQVDSATPVYRELKAKGHLYPTTIWNGGKTYDAYSSEARDIYWKYLDRGLYTKGVDAWWVDATEPDSAFCETPLEEKIGIVANGVTALGTSSRYLNTYALMTTTGIYQHQRHANPARRVMMLTRSAFAGQQRNSMAVWSGDIASTWDVFRNQIAGGVNIGMAGIPWWNSDIGGFLPKEYGGQYPLGPRDSAYVELYVRWFQFGAFCPLFRSHGTDFGKEVWQFGEPGSWGYDALIRAIDLRYRLMPYIYSVAWEVTDRHTTMMRGLPIDFTADRRVLNINDEYLFGP